MSYSGYKQSSPRTRGYQSRGYGGGSGYRGSSRGDSSNWRGGRGGYSSSSSRGRFNPNSYESRSRYSGLGVNDLYSAREDNSHRRYRDDSLYSGRDRSHRGDSPPRKRVRSDFSPASSMHHRSHDYGEELEYSNRSYSSYGDMDMKRLSRGYGGNDRRGSLREERERIRSDDYSFRKSTLSPRRLTTRGLYRGRAFSRGRGAARSSFKRVESSRGYLAKKRALIDSYNYRKRGISSKSQEYLQRLKLFRLKSKRERSSVKKSGDEENDDNDEEEEEEVEEEIEEEVEEEVTDEEENEEGEQKEGEEEEDDDDKKEDEELEDGETHEEKKKGKKTKKVKKIVKVVKKIKKKKASPKKVDRGDGNEEKLKSEGGVQITIKQDSDTRDVSDDSLVRKNRLGKPFIKLECPHCNGEYVTFKEYSDHLFTSKHLSTMTKLTLRLRQTLAKMRVDQRNEQRIIDEEAQEQNQNMRTLYCVTCKLNYRSLKSEHILSEKHVELREFLNPYCKVCRIYFRTPMVYQHHLCQLDHIKCVSLQEKYTAQRGEEGKHVDIDKFMILDSVGSGEEDSDGSGEDGVEVKKEPGDGEEVEAKEVKKKKKKTEIKLGTEFCNKIEVYYCSLCKLYLPRSGEEQLKVIQHCRTRVHLHRYVRHRDDQAMRKRAERLKQLREEAKKKEEEKSEHEGDENEKLEDEKKGSKNTSETRKEKQKGEGKEDGQANGPGGVKVWCLVDKDLDVMLTEVETGNKSSDDDDSRAGDGRYDRFKLSGKEKHVSKVQKEKDDVDVIKEKAKIKAESIEEEEDITTMKVNGDDK